MLERYDSHKEINDNFGGTVQTIDTPPSIVVAMIDDQNEKDNREVLQAELERQSSLIEQEEIFTALAIKPTP